MEKVPGHGLCTDQRRAGRRASGRIISVPIPDLIPSVYLLEIDHWSISKRYVSGWGAILKKMVDFKKENALRPNVFRYHAQLSL